MRQYQETEAKLEEQIQQEQEASEQDLKHHKELIKTLQRKVDEERRTFEEKEAKERKRVEALQCRAATTIEKQIRAHLVYKKYAPILKEKRKGRKREKELELKREAESRQEEAAKLRREEERRKLEFEKEKEAEREKLEKKRQLKKQQEEEKRKKEEELQRKKKEEQRREEERKLAEERRKREEERKLLEDRRKREEEQKLVEDRRKRGEEQKLAEERKKREEEIKLAEERKKREEEIKLAEERKKREEERKLAEERKKREEEIKLTEERMKSKEKQKEKMSFEKKKELRLNQEGSIIVNKVRNKEIEQNLSLSENLSVVLHQSECEHMPQDFNKPRAFSKDKETAVQNATKLATDTNLEMELPTEDTVKNITEKNDRCKVTIMPTKSSGFVQVTNPRVFTDCLPRRETCETKPVLNTEHINCRNEGSFELTQSIAHKLEMKSRVRALTLPDHIEQKRLNWMKTCTPWSKVSRGNKMKIVKQRIRPHKSSASQLLALNPGLILHSGSWTSLQQVTTVTFCDLPGCNLSTLSQCPSLKSLTLRNCRLETLEGISQCKGLKYIDAQENNLQNIHCHDLEDLCILLLSNNHITSMHGLENCSNLQVLELSHNQITRIGGLESLNKLQRLLVDHNQLISTKGLSETPVLLYLDCSYNHLNRIEGIDNCGLLQNLKLQSNSLSEPPRLENHVLLRELWLGDNSISSLQTLSNCWLPMLQHLSVFQNRGLDPLEVVNIRCQHCEELMQLAEECRYAHEFGDLTIAEEKEYSNIHHKGNLSVRNQHKKPATGHANKNSPDTDSQIVSNQVQTSVTHSSESRKESDHSHIMCQDSKHSKDPRVLLNEEGTAHWRGYLLRKKLSHALATVQAEEEDYNFEEVNLSEFSFDEVSLLQRIRPQNLLLIFRLINKNSARRNHSLYSTLYFVSVINIDPNKACFPTFTDILFFSVAHRGFKNTQTAQLMLKRAQKMKSKKAQGKKLLGMFTFPPVTWQSSNKLVSHKGELTDSKPASPDRLRRSRELTYQWLHTQVVDYETTSSRIMKNHHFLPELGPEILNGGRVQLVASPVGREEPDLEVGSVSSGSSIIQLGDGLNQSRLNSTGSASKFRFCMCFFSKL
uniref:Leucine-rich repeat and IQ domain-containing protein 1 n=1 Tax=Callorhinchus milii TaxID=7868 RepID=A0A4W3GG73_CALMI